MAPTIKWQRWESASYDWFGTGASDALPSVEAELDAWITTVNGNASNTGRQVTKERGYADSTTANYAGITISCGANSNTAKGYMFYGTYGSTSKRIYLGDTFTDDTSNGGYGSITNGPSDTSISWLTSGTAADFLITYGVVDGEEYFNFGPRLGGTSGSTAYMDGFTIMKGTDGEWSLFANDSSSFMHVHYFDDSVSTGFSSISRVTAGSDQMTTNSSVSYGRLEIISATTPSPGFIGASSVVAASPDLLRVNNGNGTGTRKILTDIGSGTDVYLLTAYYYGPTILVDLRP